MKRLGFTVPFVAFMCMALHGLPANAPRLTISLTDAADPPLLASSGPSNSLYRIDVSTNLADWTELGIVHNSVKTYPDLAIGGSTSRFYRCWTRPLTSQDDVKNQIQYEEDAFLSAPPPYGQRQSRWIKFALLLSEPWRIYFQDSETYLFHYDFAAARLPGFQGMSRDDFDHVSLRTNQQQVVLGAVLFPPATNLTEIGIQFVGLDPYPPDRLATWYRTVRAMILLPSSVTDYYLPTYDQSDAALENLAFFQSQGIRVSSPGRWVIGDECYAPGWCVGRLVFVPAPEIDAAYAEGRLLPADVLLLDRVPAEVPPVAGIITLSPATPSSHVALLAGSFGIPFVYLADPAMREQVMGWNGRDIMLRAVQNYGGSEVVVADIDGQLSAQQRAEILDLKSPPKLDIVPKTVAGVMSVPADNLHPGDVGIVGGKAANFGVLRRAIPQNSPSAIAFTFDLWDAYLDQILPGGSTLRQTIALELGGFAWPPDMGMVKSRLAAIRDLFTDVADFAPAQRALVLDALAQAGFDPSSNIRFRSSTNVEDTEQFVGAGLYGSFSGCLADELDGDSQGPSLCDPAEPRERGVFRALRKVYASFYNDNAFLERLRHGIDESAVGMGVLVHHSTPDPIEMANGVATFHVQQSYQRYASADLVTQQGAVSVSNPDSTARPERATASVYGSGSPWLNIESRSSLVPLGGTVLEWQSEYQLLYQLLDAAARGYESEFPGRREFHLDFEYKKVVPGDLRIKQIRELPLPDRTSTVNPFLVNTPLDLVVHQGEYGDIVANHRLKSRWTLAVRSQWLVKSNLASSAIQHIQGALWWSTNRINIDSPPASLPGYKYIYQESELTDQWTLGTAGADRRTGSISFQLPSPPLAAVGPMITLDDLTFTFDVAYATPQLTVDYQGLNVKTTNESVRLEPPTRPTAESIRQSRVFSQGKARVETEFYWPPVPTGIVAGYTAPLQAWIETRIYGLTTEPIVLRGYDSQTYRPGHHNFYESFMFDPFLEDGVSEPQRAELRAQDIRAMIISGPTHDNGSWTVWGHDGRFRSFP
ncbi:MAG TPA: PEP/pyruvate-binding domain-containing protein [Candidatus Paceibacterota bacterium]|nr:hypothetical protein [Verrucomicrobiota bacterium]HOX01907.1 PEP/pyruvate-binding domain-containing protein [Verrucomicrobiota bacterium]HRZ44619.1 PEP/pyruvate-binding domain-containing protein [Candidatus Paceibacterota bacterium]HRZ92277.1 PEP/pyruvate-binding domain-containing protein [Candidatus Paceibacterota bacterium]